MVLHGDRADAPGIATLGHGNRHAADLLALVRAAGIDQVVDVRSYPRSRRFPWFDAERLQSALAREATDYCWMGRELGGKCRAGARDADCHPALSAGFAAFAGHMATDRFARACDALRAAVRRQRVGVLCAERDPGRCHRSLIADYLVLVHGIAVTHWIEPGIARPHTASETVRVAADGTLRYDRGGTATLWAEEP